MSKTTTRAGTIEAVEGPVGATTLNADLRMPPLHRRRPGVTAVEDHMAVVP